MLAELQAQGYTGRRSTVAAYVRAFRQLGAPPPPATSTVPKVRHLTRWLLTHPDRLTADERLVLKQSLADCAHLEALAGHVTAFAEIMTHRRGDRLAGWMRQVQADDLPYLHSFVTGLKRDQAAVVAGLTSPYSSGAVEGGVNRVKMLKRQAYGRAGFDLLRKRILLAG